MEILMHRIFDRNSGHGYRVLVDRLWPRGISKKEANLDAWWKDLAPSSALRKWFNHDPEKWREFQTRYKSELKGKEGTAMERLKSVPDGKIVLLYGAKDIHINHAVVLKKYLETLTKRKAST